MTTTDRVKRHALRAFVVACFVSGIAILGSDANGFDRMSLLTSFTVACAFGIVVAIAFAQLFLDEENDR